MRGKKNSKVYETLKQTAIFFSFRFLLSILRKVSKSETKKVKNIYLSGVREIERVKPLRWPPMSREGKY